MFDYIANWFLDVKIQCNCIKIQHYFIYLFMLNISERFLTVCNDLITTGVIKNYRELAEKLDVTAAMMTEIKQKRSDVSLRIVEKLYNAFPQVNIHFLFSGDGMSITGAGSESKKDSKQDSMLISIAEQLAAMREYMSMLNQKFDTIQGSTAASKQDIASAAGKLKN